MHIIISKCIWILDTEKVWISDVSRFCCSYISSNLKVTICCSQLVFWNDECSHGPKCTCQQAVCHAHDWDGDVGVDERECEEDVTEQGDRDGHKHVRYVQTGFVDLEFKTFIFRKRNTVGIWIPNYRKRVRWQMVWFFACHLNAGQPNHLNTGQMDAILFSGT